MMALFLIFLKKKVNIFYKFNFYSPAGAMFEPQAKKNYNDMEQRRGKGGKT